MALEHADELFQVNRRHVLCGGGASVLGTPKPPVRATLLALTGISTFLAVPHLMFRDARAAIRPCTPD